MEFVVHKNDRTGDWDVYIPDAMLVELAHQVYESFQDKQPGDEEEVVSEAFGRGYDQAMLKQQDSIREVRKAAESNPPGYHDDCKEHGVQAWACAMVHVLRAPAETLKNIRMSYQKGKPTEAAKMAMEVWPALSMSHAQSFVSSLTSTWVVETPQRSEGTPIDVLTSKHRQEMAAQMNIYGTQLVARWARNGEIDGDSGYRVADALVAWLTGERL